jgi:hypothetical protein
VPPVAPVTVAPAPTPPASGPMRGPGVIERVGESRTPVLAGLVVVLAGLAALVASAIPVGPDWWGQAGSVAVASVYSWALAARTGGRPVIFGTVALAIGLATVLTDEDYLHTGAAVMTCVVAAVLAVMATVPARTFPRAVRECVVAAVIAGVGALAAVAFEPTIEVTRFEYVTFGLALAGAFGVVYRLGAGLHGLGRRGLVVVLVGAVLLAVSLAYAELLRRYASTDLVEQLLDGVRWSRRELGAFPRPIESVLGIPALAYGCHMRARRRQGWWVCAFGAAGTSAIANSLANPAISFAESALSVVYGLVVGLVLGYVVIRLDLAVTGGNRPRGTRGRRSRADEAAAAVRPEPGRTQALL